MLFVKLSGDYTVRRRLGNAGLRAVLGMVAQKNRQSAPKRLLLDWSASLPRRRESNFIYLSGIQTTSLITLKLDSRLRGNDVIWVFQDCLLSRRGAPKVQKHAFRTFGADVAQRYKTLRKSLPSSAGLRVVLMPAASIAASFSSAVPLPPEMIAPA